MIKGPSKEQEAIINAQGNVAVNAKPGSGKTFTVVEKISRVLKELPEHKGIIAISYTNKASDEILRRFKNKNISIKNSFFGTMHRLYLTEIIIPFSIFLTGKKMEPQFVDKKSVSEYYKPLLNLGLKLDETMESLLLDALKDGYILLDKAGEYACYILDKVEEAARYIKARYTTIFIDEYQDCGEAQHNVFLKMISLGLTGIAVGDLNQSIYGYDNKESKYLSSLLKMDSFSSFDLSKNYRCHKSISDYSLALYNDPHIASNVEDTRVACIRINGDESKIAKYIEKVLPRIISRYYKDEPLLNNRIAILVRNRRTGEIMDQNLKMPHKFFEPTPLDDSSDECDRIYKELLYLCLSHNQSAIGFSESYFSNDYDSKKLKKLYKMVLSLEQIKNPKLELINYINLFKDIACLILPNEKIIKTERLENVLSNSKHLESFVEANENEINIMTMHGAKGLEFEIVFHLNLNDYELPSFDGIDKDGDYFQQDINLHYVSITRAISYCCLITNSIRTAKDGTQKRSTISRLLFLNPSLKFMRRNAEW